MPGPKKELAEPLLVFRINARERIGVHVTSRTASRPLCSDAVPIGEPGHQAPEFKSVERSILREAVAPCRGMRHFEKHLA